MLRRFTLMAVLLLGLVVGSAAPAMATDPVQCPPGSYHDPRSGTCIIIVTDPGGPGGPGDGPSGPGAPGSPKPVGNDPGKCFADLGGTRTEVPCSSDLGWWVPGRDCYAQVLSPQPPQSDPLWGGHTDGAIYLCSLPPGFFGPPPWTFWAGAPPAGPAAPPDPRVLARQAVTEMNLQAVTIGIVPEDAPGRVGLIGLPTWMWAAAPGPNTMGPIIRSASTGAYTVTATAKVDRVVWSMGDGESVTCTGPGTPYADSFGTSSSPTCGHRYTRQGRYTVTATSFWTVTWNGIGQTGTIPLNFTRGTAITMGEAQVLNR